MMKKLVISFLLILSGFLLNGCGHYRLGVPGGGGGEFCSIYVRGVENESFAPQAHVLVREQVIRCLQQAGLRYEDTEEGAEAVLSIVLTDYDKVESTSQRDDTTLASSFLVKLTANVSLYNNETGECYFSDREVSASVHGQSNESIQSLMYQDMPFLTEKLSQSIRNLVIDTW